MGYVRAFVVAALAVLLGAVAYLIQTESQDAHGFKHIPLKDKSPVYIEGDTFTRKTYTFSVEGTLLEGWLYLPRAATSITMLPPLILMAHGLVIESLFFPIRRIFSLLIALLFTFFLSFILNRFVYV